MKSISYLYGTGFAKSLGQFSEAPRGVREELHSNNSIPEHMRPLQTEPKLIERKR
jgi:hypothetical protein